MINWDFLKEDNSFSTMRVAVIALIILFFPAFVGVWSYLCIKTLVMIDIPSGVIWLLGVILGAKSTQKLLEILPGTISKLVNNKEGA